MVQATSQILNLQLESLALLQPFIALMLALFIGTDQVLEQDLELGVAFLADDALVGEKIRVALELFTEEDGVVRVAVPLKLVQDVELALHGLESRLNLVCLLHEGRVR